MTNYLKENLPNRNIKKNLTTKFLNLNKEKIGLNQINEDLHEESFNNSKLNSSRKIKFVGNINNNISHNSNNINSKYVYNQPPLSKNSSGFSNNQHLNSTLTTTNLTTNFGFKRLLDKKKTMNEFKNNSLKNKSDYNILETIKENQNSFFTQKVGTNSNNIRTSEEVMINSNIYKKTSPNYNNYQISNYSSMISKEEDLNQNNEEYKNVNSNSNRYDNINSLYSNENIDNKVEN